MSFSLENLTFSRFLSRTASKYPDNVAIESSSGCISFRQLDDDTRNIAAGLALSGVRRGEHVGVWGDLGVETIYAYYAVMRLGAVAVMMRTVTLNSALDGIIDKADIDHLICGDEQLRQLEEFHVPSRVKNVFSMCGRRGLAATGFEELIKLGLTEEPEKQLEREALVDCGDTADILLTSGTTGIPKMVMISHFSRVNNGIQQAGNLSATEKDKFLTVLPMFHCFCIGTNLMASIASGGRVYLPKSRHTSDLIEALRNGCTILNAVPTQFRVLLNRADFNFEDCRELRTGIVAGNAYTPALFREIENSLGMTLITGLGMTEGTAGVTTCYLTDSLERRCSTVGHVKDLLEARIVDRISGVPLPLGEEGELCIRGFAVMQGYYKDPELTARTIDSEGWLHSGDLAWIDELNDIHISGRIKELIIRCGENVCPPEVENALMAMEEIAACKVAPTPDEIFGEEICAIIVPAEGRSVSENEIIAFLLNKLEKGKIPRYYIFIDALPLNDVGKPDLNAINAIALKAAGSKKADVR